MSFKMDSSYLYASNAIYLDYMYELYLKGQKIDNCWYQAFQLIDNSHSNVDRQRIQHHNSRQDIQNNSKKNVVQNNSLLNEVSSLKQLEINSIKADLLVDAYRKYGHMSANLNPIFQNNDKNTHLEPYSYKIDDLDCEITHKLGNSFNLLIQNLRDSYCKNVSAEFMHLESQEERKWIADKLEDKYNFDLNDVHKKRILSDLVSIQSFERFLHRKKPGSKRFSIEGAETSALILEEIIQSASKSNKIKEITLGMPHRGRLSVMTNILKKPFSAVFAEFRGENLHSEPSHFEGDVKYHMGFESNRITQYGEVYIDLSYNPSHLEAVNPVVMGKTRSKQDAFNGDKNSVIPVLFHGDASFAGQGVVYESILLSGLKGYDVGGVIHVVINNQVGFTADSSESRTERHSSYIGKSSNIPILLVNGDDPDAIAFCANCAFEFRNIFHKDIIIEVICYRKYGHNESDEPSYTQPSLYAKIKQKKDVVSIYSDKLIQEGLITENEIKNLEEKSKQNLEQEFQASETYSIDSFDEFQGKWAGFKLFSDKKIYTEMSSEFIQKAQKTLTTIPDDFNIHPKLSKLFQNKKNMFESGKNFDWGTAESLAFASLLEEGYKIRMSGQDSARGTFSHRQSVLIDQKEDNKKYIPLNYISKKQKSFEVINSPLSEYAVMGFEYGYSLDDPNNLVFWEGQFGDFVNGAQIIIDQFIASGESKWIKPNGVVLLLPHGYEGQGSEHSSGRPERFLQLCADQNMYIVNCSTPANYFHVLRRQMILDYRKPLIIFTPKSLLRHKLAVSSIDDFKGEFLEIINDNKSKAEIKSVKKVVLCTGKIYFDLLESQKPHISIIRIEQIYPFPLNELKKILNKYPKDAKIIWCQEEPKNMGSWSYIEPILNELCVSLDLEFVYSGRNPSASPASGYTQTHNKTQSELIKKTMK